jgi:sugar lactone lactonase YvrE
MVGDSPHNFRQMYCAGMAVDQKNGDLYYMAQRGRGGQLFCLRVFDRTGRYLREIMPYPANLDAMSREAFGALSIPGVEGLVPVNYYHLWPRFYPFGQFWPEKNTAGFGIAAIHPTEDSLILMDGELKAIRRIRKADGGVVGKSVVEPLWDGGKDWGDPWKGAKGAATAAISPDCGSMYFTGYYREAPKGQKLDPKWPQGRIYRVELGKGMTETFADVALPETNGVQVLCGIAVDKDGNVLVCDSGGGKVWVFSPDGKEAGVIAAPGVAGSVPDLKSGALYVLTCTGAKRATAVVKYENSRPEAKPVATLDLKHAGGRLAGDFSGPAPQLWVAAGDQRDPALLRIEEKNGKLEVAENLFERGNTASGFAIRMDVDPEADLVYIHDGWGWSIRYNGLTGEYAGKPGKDGQPAMISASELCVRRDGVIYLSGEDYEGGGFDGPWRRLNRDLSPAPLADGRHAFSYRNGKWGGGYFGNQGACVTPDGHLYFNSMFRFRSGGIFELNPDGNPGRGSRLKEYLTKASTKGTDYSRLQECALIGWLPDESGGVEVDQQGNIYAGICALPLDYKFSGDLDTMRNNPFEIIGEVNKIPAVVRAPNPGGRVTNPYGGIGSVVKFKPSGGGPVPKLKAGSKYGIPKSGTPAVVPEKLEDGIPMIADDNKFGLSDRVFPPPGEVHMEGALKVYPLLGPFSRACGCLTPRFDVDDYGRLYIPNGLTCSVRVVDNEGNEILTFGGYGNFDSQGPGSNVPKPEIPLAYPVAAKVSFKHIYVADQANRRVVRVDPAWKVEDICEVK